MASKRLGKLDVGYDQEADVLYVSLGKPREGVSVEVDEGTFIRIDPYTDEIVGITILDFKQRYMPSSVKSIHESAKAIVPEIIQHFKTRPH